MEKPVLIFGTNELARMAAAIFRENGVEVYGFLAEESEDVGHEWLTLPVLGTQDDEAYTGLLGNDCEAFLAAFSTEQRKGSAEWLRLQKHKMGVNAISQSARIAESAAIGHGTFLGQGANLEPEAELGHYTTLYPGARVGLGAQVGEHTFLGQGAQVGSGAQLGEEVFVGMGALIVSGVKVGKGAAIAPGAVVMQEVEAGQSVVGNPAAPLGRSGN